jgi:Zn-dependent metalloprotease
MCMHCMIVPESVLKRLSKDQSLSEQSREALKRSIAFDSQVRDMRENARSLARAGLMMMGAAPPQALAAAPTVSVFNCANTTNIPGAPVPNPGSSADATIKRTFVTTTDVVTFYRSVFGRNSIDNLGMALLSSVHYGVRYNNAFWNGSQMTYGDGDGQIFVDFTRGNDVVCHELTHGVTQFTLNLAYQDEPGGLNESMSDVFGSMFRQWSAKQAVTAADWLIGKDIMGPAAIARGFTCLRDMANPGAAHALAPQPSHFKKYRPGMDPHESSGIPNQAFYRAAMAVGGNSWEKVGQIWYKALAGSGMSPNMRMRTFASRTKKLAKSMYPGQLAIAKAVTAGWKAVGL